MRVWIPGSAGFRFGQPVSVMFEVSEDAHAVVLRVDGSGRLSVLWPQNRNLQTAARAGREYRITGPYSSVAAFNADYEYASGMVIAIASHDPIDLSAYRRYRNDQSFWHYAGGQRPYYGGVRRVLDRITQEVLYAPDSPYDYDIAFYSVAGRGFYSNASFYASCQYDFIGYPGLYNRSHTWWGASGFSGWVDDCYGSAFSRAYLAYCASWVVSTGYIHCPSWNPSWPVPPVAGTPQPQPPKPNTGMIDTIISRPVAQQPTTNGTTHIVRMEPVRDPPNVTRWLPESENDAISIPRLRRGANEGREQSRGGDRINTRDEGFTRSPGTTIRTADPRAGDPPPDRGTTYMPPVRHAPREPMWRDNDRPDRGATPPQRWERPASSEPGEPRHRPSAGSGVDRGSTTGTGGAVMTPRTDASVSKTSETKTSETKPPPERKPQ